MTTTQPDHQLIFDLSKFNGRPIDPADLRSHGCHFVMLRVTQGTDEVDACAAGNVAAAKAAGCTPIAYHALLPGNEAAQASFFAQQCVHLGLTPSAAGHIVDFEIHGADLWAFCDALRVAMHGVKIGVYSSPAFYNGAAGSREFPGDFIHVAQWLSEPRTGDPEHVLASGGADGNGVTPGWWTPFTGCQHYALRQFTSQGSLHSVSPVDVSVSYETPENLHTILATSPPPPIVAPPVEPPAATGFHFDPPNLVLGDTGFAVCLAQGCLLAHEVPPIGLCNASGVPDGVYGAATEAAVKAAQAAWGIKVDGLVGPETWRHLVVFQS